MSGTTAGADATAAASTSPTDDEIAPDEVDESGTEPFDAQPGTTDDAGTDEVAAHDSPEVEPGSDVVGDSDAAEVPAPEKSDGGPPPLDGAVEDELGFAVPTWYVLFCALPFAAAFLVPITVIYRAQNSVPPMSAASAAWLGVATGWVLWLVGTAGWLLGPVVLAGARRRAPKAWAWWHRTTRAWVIVVLAWGLVATLSVLAVAVLLGRVSARA